MAEKFSRRDILERLHKQVDSGKMILAFGAGIGLTAKCAELGEADLICVYSTAKYRMMGKPSLLAWMPYSNANETMFDMAREILPSVKKTPCIAGIGAHDPKLDMEILLNRSMEMGFSGITNEPFVGIYGREFGMQLEKAGIGFSKEVELIEIAHKMDIFTMAWAFNSEEAARMAQAGADIVGAMVGVTSGGLSGAGGTLNIENAVNEIQKMCSAAKKVNPDIMVLTHGGPIKDVPSAQYSVKNSAAVGYVAGSSGERIPTEEAVTRLTKEYKQIDLSDK